MIVVSACLLGTNCKYNGGNNLSDAVAKYVKSLMDSETEKILLVCPEAEGGLPTPRPPFGGQESHSVVVSLSDHAFEEDPVSPDVGLTFKDRVRWERHVGGDSDGSRGAYSALDEHDETEPGLERAEQATLDGHLGIGGKPEGFLRQRDRKSVV